MISESIKHKAIEIISGHTGKQILKFESQAIGGGDINAACKLTSGLETYFIKYNDAFKYPAMFMVEAMGLNVLKAANELYIPEVIGYGEADKDAFLILEYINQGVKIDNFWHDFGHRLALLHTHTSEYFGLDNDNYIGSLHQSNNKQITWSNFFVEERLLPQIKLARNKGEIRKLTVDRLENFFKYIEELFPKEKPSLVHGDLWNGNYMIAPDGTAALIDPAVYYGHREMDIAMTQLFGGFPKEFYEGYNERYPMEKDWRKRMDYYNLYPLMVHVNLFGGGYLHSVENIINKF